MNASFVTAELKSLSGSPNGYYDQFYGAMKSWGRYQLVSTPSEADVVFEILATNQFGSANPDIRLRILDLKSKIVLWVFVDVGGRKKDWNKALAKLVTDVQMIATPSQAPPASRK